ncbi:uncharacterized protein LOC132927029 [Rhopalosiphum padi]|uniref:uncharacterized protein LOC132927029 n=1 Tax=Rhopalosiphum padi TaxID=40932 RepID=UPI00298DE1C9|nr:uncharacterized protein LOC132927029 [Rhopalosiphum padi]
MSSSRKEDLPSKPTGSSVSKKTEGWLVKKNPSSSKLYNCRCPYTLRKTGQFIYNDQLWTVGDIVSLHESKSSKIFYAQIIELHENDLCENRAKIFWLVPKANIGVTDESKKVHHDTFKPTEFVHISVDERFISMDCLTFVMNVPNLFEYRQHVETDYLVNTYIAPHSERYAESSSESDGNKGKRPKCRITQLTAN